MPSTHASARVFLLAVLLSGLAGTGLRAQEAEPEAPPATAEAPKARPKPRPKPAAPRPAAKPAPAPASAAPAASPSAVWPAGASTVSESYGDWTMTCVRLKETTSCIVAQSQGDAQTGRRKFGLELQTSVDGRSAGLVLMPFGLAIEPGVTFKLDDQVLGKGAPYTTCGAEGCVVPISFPTLATDGMRTAKALTVTGQKPGGTEPSTITVPLVGFAQAFDRATAMSR